MKGLILEQDKRCGKAIAFCLCVAGIATLLVSDLSVYATQFFKTNSTWYTKIPANPALRSGSANYVNYIISNQSIMTVSNTEWSVPVYYATASTPTYNIEILERDPVARNAILSGGWNLNVPIPAGAKQASYGLSGYRDGHMVVIREDLATAWDFFRAEVDQKRAYRVKRFNLNGDGILQPATWGGCRVSPAPLLHGLITYDEIQRGYIDHAIAFATWSAKTGSPGVYPLVTTNSGDSTDPYAPWLGMRFQLDPSLDINSLNLTPAGKVIARALQEYGMIFLENNGPGSNGIYAESLDFDSGRTWSGILSPMTTAGIPLNRFRLVEPIYPSSTPASNPSPSNLRIVP